MFRINIIYIYIKGDQCTKNINKTCLILNKQPSIYIYVDVDVDLLLLLLVHFFFFVFVFMVMVITVMMIMVIVMVAGVCHICKSIINL